MFASNLDAKFAALRGEIRKAVGLWNIVGSNPQIIIERHALNEARESKVLNNGLSDLPKMMSRASTAAFPPGLEILWEGSEFDAFETLCTETLIPKVVIYREFRPDFQSAYEFASQFIDCFPGRARYFKVDWPQERHCVSGGIAVLTETHIGVLWVGEDD